MSSIWLPKIMKTLQVLLYTTTIPYYMYYYYSSYTITSLHMQWVKLAVPILVHNHNCYSEKHIYFSFLVLLIDIWQAVQN